MRNQPLTFFSLLVFFTFTNLGKAQDCNNNGIPDEQEISRENHTLDWVNTYEPTGTGSPFVHIADTAIDHEGNLILMGIFKGSVDFDPTEGTDIRNSSAASSIDLYISKLSSEGAYLWTKTFGGTAETQGTALAIDSQNQIIVTGTIKNIASLNQGFVRKLNGSNGNTIWNLTLGTFAQGFAKPRAVVVDSQDQVFLSGEFYGNIDFDPSAGGTDFHDAEGTSTSFSDAFLTKFSSTGTYFWTRSFGGAQMAVCADLAIDSTNTLLLVGGFLGSVDFDPDPKNEDIEEAPLGGAFLSKFDPDGFYLGGHRQIRNDGSYFSLNYLAIDSQDSVFLGFIFSGQPTDFNPDPFAEDIHSSAGGHDVAISKFLSDGSYQWTRSIGGIGADYLLSMEIDSSDSVLFAGFFIFTVDFDPGIGTDFRTPTPASKSDIFLSHLSSSGNYLGALTLGGSGEDAAYSIAPGPNRQNYLTGKFQSTIDFDPTGGQTLRTTASTIGGAFVARFPFVPPAPDQNGNGVPDECEAGIVNSIPPDNTIDARQPFPIGGGPAQGIQLIEFEFGSSIIGATPLDFSITEEGGDGVVPLISLFALIIDTRIRIQLDSPIEVGAWTVFTHLPSNTSVRLGYLPADANGDGTASAVDILALIDSLNGVTPRPIESTDIDRSGIANPADILRLIDLLNGAGPYDPYLG